MSALRPTAPSEGEPPVTGLPPLCWGFSMGPGDQVRVCRSVVLFHHPQHRGQPHDMEGQQGEVLQQLTEWKGRPISPTLPVVVAFGKFRAHFRADELELV